MCAIKKTLKPALKRMHMEHLREEYWVSERGACEVIGIWSPFHWYSSQRKDDRALRFRIREIAETRVRYGYFRIHALLRREGWRVNHKRVYRIYHEEGLNLLRKHPRRYVTGSRRLARPEVKCPNTCWSMDFVSDSFFDGHCTDIKINNSLFHFRVDLFIVLRPKYLQLILCQIPFLFYISKWK